MVLLAEAAAEFVAEASSDSSASSAWVSGLKWTLVVALIVVGFIGTFLPLLPGTTFILAGMLFHYFLLGMEDSGLTWQALVIISLLYLASLALDWFSGAIGAKWFGSSRWGIGGAILGGIVGIFFGLPGLIIGPIVGVFLFEMLFAKKRIQQASNSTVGTVVGGLAGLVGKVLLALAMVAVYLVDVFLLT